MKWFKPKFSVCSECGVHYDPVIGIESPWGHLCKIHRKPVMENDLRKGAVVSWASANWEKLEPAYLKEQEANQASYNQAPQQYGLSSLAAARDYGQHLAGHPQFGKGIRGVFGIG